VSAAGPDVIDPVVVFSKVLALCAFSILMGL
jgi:hypothetical protein